jgi:UDP:flavonoid glycosyltransferase YjiC (YdhE family)
MMNRCQPYEPPRRIAFFISPHGFGHAARAASVMEALTRIDSSHQFDIFTTVPQWFFANCNSFTFQYHRLLTDIGLVQRTPFEEDLPATVQKLKKFLPFNPSRIAAAAEKIMHLKCKMVICDIAPMGIRVARAAGVPSVLIESFTWDWIYRGYAAQGLNQFETYLQSIFAEATYRIQTQPICKYADADFTAGPASRKTKNPSKVVRRRLGLSDSCKAVVITAGGVPKSYRFIDKLKKQPKCHFIIPGAGQSEEIHNNLILLPEDSAYCHPDLIDAADAVIGKAGYSTIAEVYHAGVPFGYVARNSYRESEPLIDFIEKNINGLAIGESEFENGMFVSQLEKLLEIPRIQRNSPNGADQIAAYITDQIMKQS